MNIPLPSILRTLIPAAWGTLIAYAVHKGLQSDIASQLANLGTTVLVPAATTVWYSLMRWLEPLLPSWLVRLVLGSVHQPVYPTKITVTPTRSGLTTPDGQQVE